MDFLKIFTLVLLFGYGLLIALAGPQQWRQKRVQGWSAIGMLLAGLALLYGAYLLFNGSTLTMGFVAVGLLATHILTIFNGLHIHGKINWIHHAGRAFLSLAMLVLTYYALNLSWTSAIHFLRFTLLN